MIQHRAKADGYCINIGLYVSNAPAHLLCNQELSLKPGTLDDTAWLNPTEHYWTKRRQSWVPMPDDAVCFAHDG